MEIKQKVIAHLINLIESQLESVSTDLAALQDAKENDTKSSMGDKYETSAEMLSAEQDKLTAQQVKLQQFLVQLSNFQSSKPTKAIKLGSLVQTNRGFFLIGIPFGQFKIDEQIVMAISAASPVGQLMLNKIQGEKFEFRGVGYEVVEVW